MSIVQKSRNSELVQKLGAVQVEEKDGKEKGRRKGRSVRIGFKCKRDDLNKMEVYFPTGVKKSRAGMTALQSLEIQTLSC